VESGFPQVVIVETAWVLRVAYTFDRAAIAWRLPHRHNIAGFSS
jgi:hypothetical protein